MRLLFWPSTWRDSTNRRIFRAATTIASLTLLVKTVTALKDLVVARWFGRSDSLDAFLIAYLVPYFVMSLTVGALVTTFVPEFVEVRQKQGNDAAQKLFSSVVFLSVIILTGVALLLGLLAPHYLPYLGSSFSPPKLRLTRELLYLLLPFTLFGGATVFVSAVVNAGERFALPALAPLLTPLVTILLLEAAAQRWGAFALAAGMVAGSILETVLVVRVLGSQGMHFIFRWGGFDSNIRRLARQYGPMLAANFLMCFVGVADQSMAAMLPGGGSVAALSYASKAIGLVVALGAAPLGAAVLPYFAKMVAQSDWDGCWHTLKRYSALVALVTVPITIFLMVFSKPLIRLIFQRGAFSGADTDLVSWVQICYAPQIPFYICGLLFIRFLSSIRRNDVLMYGAAITLVLDIVLNLVLMRVWGVAGIALSSSIVYMVSFLFVSICSVRILTRRRLRATIAPQTQEAIR
jgi:putative peptidoglycan lipid II flippase